MSKPTIPRLCETCGATFYAWPYAIRQGGARFCSATCRAAGVGAQQRGENHPLWQGRTLTRVCEVCGNEFTITASVVEAGRGRFCSLVCKDQWQRTNAPRGSEHPQWNSVKLTCDTCGAAIERAPATVKAHNFCSRKCQGQWQSAHRTGESGANWRGGPVTATCEQCGESYTVPVSEVDDGKRRFCSFRCKGEWQSATIIGPAHPLWLGGKSFEPYPPTFNDRFKRLIRERDGYRCALCDAPGSTSVHHINYVKSDTTPGNCITLCRPCHTKTNHNRAYWQAFFEGFMAARRGIVSNM